jgi:hypothetical protein
MVVSDRLLTCRRSCAQADTLCIALAATSVLRDLALVTLRCTQAVTVGITLAATSVLRDLAFVTLCPT